MEFFSSRESPEAGRRSRPRARSGVPDVLGAPPSRSGHGKHREVGSGTPAATQYVPESAAMAAVGSKRAARNGRGEQHDEKDTHIYGGSEAAEHEQHAEAVGEMVRLLRAAGLRLAGYRCCHGELPPLLLRRLWPSKLLFAETKPFVTVGPAMDGEMAGRESPTVSQDTGSVAGASPPGLRASGATPRRECVLTARGGAAVIKECAPRSQN